ncbi:MAG: SRPBCC domain-containing protein [Microcoleus sp. SIO2G3]|nr:SRPBCC domain-containing protein [Microcoleus sp. SIO2G3]
MLRDVKTEVFYPYPPERVWQVLTNRRALAAWLMDNDFEPRVGHKFCFQPNLQQGIEEAIHCEVIELNEPRSLSYTWRGGFIGKPTIVTWTLLPVNGGTQLQLEHKGLENQVTPLSQPMRLAQARQDNSIFRATLKTQLLEPSSPKMPFSLGYARVNNIDHITLNFYLCGGWHPVLNNRLQTVLADITQHSHLVAASNVQTEHS